MTFQDDFRLAMRSYIYSVVFSFSIKAGTAFVMLLQYLRLLAISMEPPSLLVCINIDSKIHDELIVGSEFCINLLTKRSARYF